ncbi:signal recognition particle protein Srp54 [Methanopyrus kandleri]|uniref:Signal recognition particle 54 kDa protein n=2 Tax=Methanopyrus kandleri TaxID=2320 RepID=SRP54_METKA|nr:signal recognition particle protein Srp54 [Methanopyrus kandleri]Q8TUY9.1 RecName: Full=Signal recognition particle 54 kDa protein; Short=SRP54 [Methanopyrus kandleri AV19]AAM02825.1 Signal recognition particle GTPase [Methanopyrus kandleri AV19]HII71085.1 signal recognition particle protein [Methanopyrus kandleri]
MIGFADRLAEITKKIKGASIIDEDFVKEVVRDVQRALLEADVDVKLVLELSKRIEKRALEEEPPAGVPKRDYLLRIVYEELVELLGGEKTEGLDIDLSRDVNVIMLVGLYGMGKTTTAAKLARYLQRKGYRVGLVGADPYRPAAGEQLRQLAEEVDVPVHVEDVDDAVEMAVKGVEALKDECDVVIVDTAGRDRLSEDLIDELREMAERIEPHEVLLVLDATVGQKAGDHAEAFHEAVQLTGVVITKLDTAAKGGGALSAVARTGAPIKFVGTGERVDDLEEFNPRSFVARLLGIGDIDELLRRTEEMLEEEEKAEDVLEGEFTLKDLYEQLEALSKMGPVDKLLQYVPGMGGGRNVRKISQITEERLKKYKVIMDSMTEKELENPEILNKSRIRRIAIGSGTSERDVIELLNHYRMMKDVIEDIQSGRIPRIGGELGRVIRNVLRG